MTKVCGDLIGCWEKCFALLAVLLQFLCGCPKKPPEILPACHLMYSYIHIVCFQFGDVVTVFCKLLHLV